MKEQKGIELIVTSLPGMESGFNCSSKGRDFLVYFCLVKTWGGHISMRVIKCKLIFFWHPHPLNPWLFNQLGIDFRWQRTKSPPSRPSTCPRLLNLWYLGYNINVFRKRMQFPSRQRTFPFSAFSLLHMKWKDHWVTWQWQSLWREKEISHMTPNFKWFRKEDRKKEWERK